MKYVKETFLGLTSLNRFIDKSQSILFLKRTYKIDEEIAQKSIDASVLISPYEGNYNYDEHYQYIISVYKKLLPEIALKLNRYHGVSYSTRYWRYMIGTFLFFYISVIYDRYLHLKAAYQLNPNFDTIGLSSDSYLTTLCTNEFICLSGSSEKWNLQLFTQLIEICFKKPIMTKTIVWDNELEVRKDQYIQSNYKTKTKLIFFFLKRLNKIIGKNSIGMFAACFSSYKEFLRLFFLSGCCIFPILPIRPINTGQVLSGALLSKMSIDYRNRLDIFNLQGVDFLSELVLKTLVVNMPMVFIEGYKSELALSRKYFPFNCRLIFEQQCGSHDYNKWWVASQMERGASLVGFQHGGSYGMQKIHLAGFTETDVSDFFITWGWQYENNHVAAPVPILTSILQKYYRKRNTEKLKRIIYLPTSGEVLYQHCPGDMQIKNDMYLSLQKEFIKNLGNSVVESLSIRSDPHSLLLFLATKKNIPHVDVYLPKNRDDFFADIHTAKILVIDHASTPILFALALNIPTICFWRSEDWILLDEVKPYIDELKNVGIYHNNPKSAAQQLNEIAANPNDWWYSEATQRAREKFCNQFVRESKNYVKEWSELLLKISRMPIKN